jgi:hypothetical protein
MKTELLKRAASYSLETLKDSFFLTFRNFFPLLAAWFLSLGLPVIFMIVGGLGGSIMDHLSRDKHSGMSTLFGSLIPGLFLGLLWSGWIFSSLKAARRDAIRFGDLFRPIPQMFSAFAVLIITTILISLGMTILVLPGAFLFLKWQLAPYYIVDQGSGPIEALKLSWQDTNEVFVPLAILDLCFAGLHAALSFTGIGLVLLHMVLAVASALVYSKWLGDEESRIELKQVLES